MISGLLISLFGAYLISGEYETRHCFIEVLSYIAHLVTYTVNSVTFVMEEVLTKNAYISLQSIYATMPRNVYSYFEDFPDAFIVCGWVLVLYGIMKIFRP